MPKTVVGGRQGFGWGKICSIGSDVSNPKGDVGRGLMLLLEPGSDVSRKWVWLRSLWPITGDKVGVPR